MIIINNKMFGFLLKNTIEGEINIQFKKILNSNFIEHDGCYFLKKLFNIQKHISESDFSDKTQYECFINSINLDDYINNNYLIQGILLIKEIERKWKRYKNNLSLIIILGETNTGFNLKFHLLRPNEEWINMKEVEKFKEAILLYNVSKHKR